MEQKLRRKLSIVLVVFGPPVLWTGIAVCVAKDPASALMIAPGLLTLAWWGVWGLLWWASH